jgi:hypothetical protein
LLLIAPSLVVPSGAPGAAPFSGRVSLSKQVQDVSARSPRLPYIQLSLKARPLLCMPLPAQIHLRQVYQGPAPRGVRRLFAASHGAQPTAPRTHRLPRGRLQGHGSKQQRQPPRPRWAAAAGGRRRASRGSRGRVERRQRPTWRVGRAGCGVASTRRR